MKVYLDDERPTPEGWTRTYTAQETIELLRTGQVESLSLDHDLGDEAVVGTGYDVLLWLEEQVVTGGFKAPSSIFIHSANSGAWGKMIQAVESIRSRG